MKTKIWLILPDYIEAKEEHFLYGMVETVFRKEEVLNAKHHKGGDVKNFDFYCDCKALVLMPSFGNALSTEQLHVAKIFEVLKSPIYLLTLRGLTICETAPVRQQLTNGD
jgi:hypothetical protein